MPDQSTPWFDEFIGVAYRYYDLRMNVVPLFTDQKDSLNLWRDSIHWWFDPSIKIRFVESGDSYWFIMGADSQKQDTNISMFKLLPKSEHYERFKKGHGGEAYLRFGVYTEKKPPGFMDKAKEALTGGKYDEDDEEDENETDFQVNLLKRKKTVTDIKFLNEENAKDDALAWNCLNINKYSKSEEN